MNTQKIADKDDEVANWMLFAVSSEFAPPTSGVVVRATRQEMVDVVDRLVAGGSVVATALGREPIERAGRVALVEPAKAGRGGRALTTIAVAAFWSSSAIVG